MDLYAIEDKRFMTPSTLYQEADNTDPNILLTLRKDNDPDELKGCVTIPKGSMVKGDPILGKGRLTFTLSESVLAEIRTWTNKVSNHEDGWRTSLRFTVQAMHRSELTARSTFCMVLELKVEFVVGFFAQPYIQLTASDPTSLHWTAPRMRFALSPTRRKWRRWLAILAGAHRQTLVREHLIPWLDFLSSK